MGLKIKILYRSIKFKNDSTNNNKINFEMVIKCVQSFY